MDERIRIALRQRGVRIALIAILAVVVLVALIIMYRTVSPPAIPNAPSDLMATAVSHSRIDLIWQDNSDNETGFNIERKTGASGTYSQIATVGPNVTTYPNTGLSPDTTYDYRVRAYNDDGDSPYSGEVSAATSMAPPPPPPENHPVGTSVLGSKYSISIISVTKTDRYCDYHMAVPLSRECFAPTGTAFITVLLSTTNYSSDIISLKRVDFSLRDSATGGIYALFDYPLGPYPAGGTGLGEPFPMNAQLYPDQTITGVIVYLVSETASLSGMEVVYELDGGIHIWQP